MSETKAEYRINLNDLRERWQIRHEPEPQGEINDVSGSIRQYPAEPDGESLDSRIVRLENMMKELNMAWLEIEPYIDQHKQMKKSKSGIKWVYPCANRLFAILTNLSREIYQLKREASRG